MRIAQIAPLTEPVPPKLYAVSFLTEELVSMGHEVTLFASGDSGPRAKLRRGGHVRCGSRRRSVTRSHRIW